MHFDFAQYKQRGFSTLVILLSLLLLGGLIGGAFYLGKLPLKPQDKSFQACTQEAKQCPDGSYVSRAGPKCEFTSCPAVSPIPSEETGEWKTYTSKNMNFSMKIPPLWFEHSEEKSFSYYRTHFSYPLNNPSTQSWEPQQKAQLIITTTSTEETIEQQVQQRLNTPYSILKKETKPIKIDGENGVVLYSKDNYYEEVLVNHKGSSYSITLGTVNFTKEPDYLETPLQEVEPVFNQILSTFKFIDQNQMDTSGWKTYTSTQLPNNSLRPYSLQHPSSWIQKHVREDRIDTLTLTKNQYIITIYQAPFGGVGCIFEGEVPKGTFEDLRDKKYVEINSGIGV